MLENTDECGPVLALGGCGGHLSVHLPEGKGVNVGPNLFVDASGTIVSPQMAELESRLARCTAALDAVREVGP